MTKLKFFHNFSDEATNESVVNESHTTGKIYRTILDKREIDIKNFNKEDDRYVSNATVVIDWAAKINDGSLGIDNIIPDIKRIAGKVVFTIPGDTDDRLIEVDINIAMDSEHVKVINYSKLPMYPMNIEIDITEMTAEVSFQD